MKGEYIQVDKEYTMLYIKELFVPENTAALINSA